MEAILVAIGAVALAEMGDKTQLLAFLLASRFKKPTPIILGILVATIFNHSLASALGAWITHVFSPEVIKWIIVGSFLAMAAWILIPDKGDDDALKNHSMRFGVFGVTFITFFLAEWVIKLRLQPSRLPSNTRSDSRCDRHYHRYADRGRPGGMDRRQTCPENSGSNSSVLPPQSCLLRSVFWPRLNTRRPSSNSCLSQIRPAPQRPPVRRVNFLCNTDRSTRLCPFEK